MKITFLPDGREDYQFWAKTDRKVLARLNRLINEAARTPSEGTGNPELLCGNLSGWWSRRIDQKHRLVYRWREGALEIVQCRFHYDDH